jgi:hypothetical protein
MILVRAGYPRWVRIISLSSVLLTYVFHFALVISEGKEQPKLASHRVGDILITRFTYPKLNELHIRPVII